VLDFIRETVLSYRHSHSLTLAFVLWCLLPVALLNGVIFYWVFSALSSLRETLKEHGQIEKLSLFERLWKFLIGTLASETFSLLFEMFILTRSVTERWKYQWMLSDGISHALFLLVLAAMMFLWSPNKHSQQYAYSQQIDDSENPRAQLGSTENRTVWAEDDDGEQSDADSFRADTGGGNGVAPAVVIGALPMDQDGIF